MIEQIETCSKIVMPFNQHLSNDTHHSKIVEPGPIPKIPLLLKPPKIFQREINIPNWMIQSGPTRDA
jgi:hypothetical protein